MSASHDRREFLRRATAALPLLHPSPLALAQLTTPTSAQAGASSRARFARLRLRAAPIDEMERFYRETLRLPVARKDDGLLVTAGETIIEFGPAAANSRPYYHFAFNIPHNLLDSAVKWMNGRAPLIQRNDGGGVVFHFASWDAHAIYFLDPAGNIVEFIARHTLANDAPAGRAFSERDILCASEIGAVSPDVPTASKTLCESLALPRYHGGDENFTAVGDEHGLFIVVKTGRRWFSSDRSAEVFEAEAVVRGARRSFTLDSSRFAVVDR